MCFVSSISFSQKLKFGGRLEPSLSWGSTKTYSTDEKSSFDYRCSDIRLSLSLEFSNNFTLSLRPGIVLGSDYGGASVGLFGSIRTYNHFYTLIGFDLMQPLGGGGHASGSKDVILPYPVIGSGYKFNNDLSFELQFHYSLNQVTHSYRRVGAFPSGDYELYKMYWLLKFSIGFHT